MYSVVKGVFVNEEGSIGEVKLEYNPPSNETERENGCEGGSQGETPSSAVENLVVFRFYLADRDRLRVRLTISREGTIVSQDLLDKRL